MTDESTSPERQREQIATWAKLHSHDVVKVTEDTDVSGAMPATARPELGPWLTDPSLASRWTTLVVAKLDRVTRSVSDLCNLIDYCQANGKVLVSIAESFDLGTPAGRMVATILASVAAFERERTAERRREAADYLRKQARYGGGVVPFGYRAEEMPGGGWRLLPDEEEAEVVRWAAGQLIAGRSLKWTCEELGRRGIETSRGRPAWHETSLMKIMRSPVLIGHVLHNGTVTRDDDGVVVRRDPILTDETWARLQAALSRLSRTRVASRSSPLIGVLFCALCHGPMYIQRRTERPSSYYRCRKATRDRACAARIIPAPPIEEMITSGLLDSCGDIDMADEVVVPGEDHTAELHAVEEALSHFEDQLVGTQISPEAWGRAVARLEKRQAELRALPQLPARSEWVPTGKTFAQTWEALDEAGRRALLLANGVTVAARRRPGGEDFSVAIGLSAVRDDGSLQLPPNAEDRSDILIWRRGDLEATIHLGNLHRLRMRLAQAKALS